MSKGSEELARSFRAAGQGHVFHWWDEIGAEGRARLSEQLRSVDLQLLTSLIADMKAIPPGARQRGKPEFPEYVPLPRNAEDVRKREAARSLGEDLLRAGKVAPLMAAGGQATRLGLSGPKGSCPIGPVSKKPLFQIHAERIRAVRRRCARRIPWYIMTSEPTDQPTREFFKAHDYFGLPGEDVRFFKQRMMPVVDRDSRLVMRAKDALVFSPNGNGGVFPALVETGVLDEMRARGVEEIIYFQVDNPLVQSLDPVFAGFHRTASAEMSSKAVAKRDPDEPVAAFVKLGGRVAVVEYSELSERQKRERGPDGRLLYGLSSPAMHIFGVDFVKRLTADGIKLPFHVASKRSPCLNEQGDLVQPAELNVRKFELFIFDAMREAERWLILEVRREEEFSPVKNQTGNDSIESCRRDMMALHAGWLDQAGICVPRDASGRPLHPVEISPLYAMDASELAARVPKGLTVNGPLYLGPEE